MIARFGRHPHRSEILGRQSTPRNFSRRPPSSRSASEPPQSCSFRPTRVIAPSTISRTTSSTPPSLMRSPMTCRPPNRRARYCPSVTAPETSPTSSP
ncbi:MAG: DUF924 domain-containing protein [Beggiatoa sp.]|nr:DUF924 domain-containing protein [Beggiatoa sp.]